MSNAIQNLFFNNFARHSFGKTFSEKSTNASSRPGLKYGLYVTSLCDALKLTVLTPYRQCISDLEKSLLREHYLNVTYLQTHLETHFILFQSICNLLIELERKQLHGCQIIDLIYRYSISGNSGFSRLDYHKLFNNHSV